MQINTKPYQVVAIKDDAGFNTDAAEVLSSHTLHLEAVKKMNDLERQIRLRIKQNKDTAGVRHLGIAGPVGLFQLRPI